MSVASEARAFLRCEGVLKRFGATVAVDHADLEVREGELVALLGPSGCGKTTLLRLIGGFEAPEAGSIELAGRVLADASTFVPPERRRVAMVFQDFALFPHMTVLANIAFGLSKTRDRTRRVDELLELVGLSGLGRRMPHELSGGQQQRVALARALGSEPDLVLLDEAFSNLDPTIRRRVRAEVRTLLRAVGTTAVFVTHDQEEALSLADRIAVMVEGRILQLATPPELYARPAQRAVAEFIGEANFLPGEAREDSVDCELGVLPSHAGFTGPAQVMVRAEDLELTAAEDGVPAEVLASEYYGHDQVVHLRLPSGWPVMVRLVSSTPLEAGARVRVRATGEVLAYPA